MQQVFQSSFLQALGFAIANSLWQTALIWLLYVAVNSMFTLSSARKYRLAVTAQLFSFIWFVCTLQFYFIQYQNSLSRILTTNINPNSQIGTSGSILSVVINSMVKGEQLLPYVSAAYLLLIFFLGFRWAIGYRQTQKIQQEGLHKFPAELRLFVKKITEQFAIKKEIRLFLSETVKTPLTIGFFKPIILLPIASINHLSIEQLEAVLLHEMAHIKRYDYLANLILSVIEIGLFFNPFTRLLSKQIHQERENSCDDWVLQYQYSAATYSEALLRIAYLQTAPALAMAASGKKNDLLQRIKRMIDKKENRFNYRKQLLALLIVTGMLSSIAWMNPAHNLQSSSRSTAISQKFPALKKTQYTVEPMTVSIDNPLFNPVFFLNKPLKEEMKKDIAAAQQEMKDASTDIKNNDLISSITPMVADAMEQASSSINLTEKAMLEQKLTAEKLNLEEIRKTVADTLLKYKKMVPTYQAEFNYALKLANEELKKAKKEMEQNFAKDLKLNFDKKMVESEVNKALKDAGIEALEQLVMNSIQLSSMAIQKSIENIPQIHIKENSEDNKPKKRSRTEDIQNPPVLVPQEGLELNEEAPIAPAPKMRQEYPIKMSPEKLKLLKELYERKMKTVRVVPVMIREESDSTKGQRIIIQLQ